MTGLGHLLRRALWISESAEQWDQDIQSTQVPTRISLEYRGELGFAQIICTICALCMQAFAARHQVFMRKMLGSKVVHERPDSARLPSRSLLRS